VVVRESALWLCMIVHCGLASECTVLVVAVVTRA